MLKKNIYSKLITVEKYGSPKARLEFAITNGTCVIDSALVFVGIPTDPTTGDAQYQTILMDYINSSVGYNWLGISGGGIQFTDDDWNALNDKALYDIRFLTSGAYPSIPI